MHAKAIAATANFRVYILCGRIEFKDWPANIKKNKKKNRKYEEMLIIICWLEPKRQRTKIRMENFHLILCLYVYVRLAVPCVHCITVMHDGLV